MGLSDMLDPDAGGELGGDEVQTRVGLVTLPTMRLEDEGEATAVIAACCSILRMTRLCIRGLRM